MASALNTLSRAPELDETHQIEFNLYLETLYLKPAGDSLSWSSHLAATRSGWLHVGRSNFKQL